MRGVNVGLDEFRSQMLIDTKPKTFAGLVKISGLSHGTDVWLKNAQSLVQGTTEYGKITFEEIIACRDDIMVQLSERGLQPLKAFEIMEFVRKGKPSKDKATWLDYEQEMRKNNVPEWYIWSASQIKYMFPKAHATAYVIMAMRIAWFKVYHPLAYYVSYFTLRCNAYDIDVMRKGSQAIMNRLTDIDKRLRDSSTKFQVTNKEKELYNTLEVALEMTLRGYRFHNIDLKLSQADEFLIHPNDSRILIPPFKVLDGLGENAARSIVEAREKCFFLSKEDLQSRTQINGTQIRKM
ncbi:MAG: PolC-type DNA polymerase III, partial [Tenericutes bacterium HGW-Tenericutes-7]